MPSPFPGMDPYLEVGYIWPDLHHGLISASQAALAPQLPREYYIRVEQRTYMAVVEPDDHLTRPDLAVMAVSSDLPPIERGGAATAVVPAKERVTLPLSEEIREGYLEIREVGTHSVVTSIEILSPTNKAPGAGREMYERKRLQTLDSETNLVEIDLLRGGRPMAMYPRPESSYRIVVSRAWERPEADLQRFGVRDAIPEIAIPLRHGEPEPRLSLGPMLASIYDIARYDISVDYQQPPPPPPLSPEDAAWVEALLREKGLRPAPSPPAS
jgi:hypothetical protein